MTDSNAEFQTAQEFINVFTDGELQTVPDFLSVFDDGELWDDLAFLASEPSSAAPFPSTVSKRVRRVTPKKQIDQLQNEIRQLSARLHTLEDDATQRHPHSRCCRSELWRQLAMQQLERRRNSESENLKLREMVKLQIEEAKSLSRILKRRTRIQRLQKMLEGNQSKRQKETAVSVHEGEKVFEEMLHDVDDHYKKMDSLFTEKGMHNIPCPGQKRHTNNTMLNGVCFELTQRKIVPFGVKSVKDAVWMSLRQFELEGLRSVAGFKASVQFRKQDSGREMTTEMTSFLAALLGDRPASIKTRKVVRRYDEESRSVFIYQTSMSPNRSKPVGVHAISTLLIEVRHDDLDDRSTLIQSHFSVTRHDEGLAAGNQLRLPVNLNISIAVWDETISRIHVQVENHLLDRASCKPNGMIGARAYDT